MCNKCPGCTLQGASPVGGYISVYRGGGYIPADILQCKEGGYILQCIYCRGYIAVQRGGGGGWRGWARLMQAVGSHQLLLCRFSAPALYKNQYCTKMHKLQRCTKMHENVQRCTHGTGSELAALPTFVVCQQCASLSLRLRASSIKI